MAVTSGWYATAVAKAFAGEIIVGTHTIKVMATTSAHTIDQTHDYKNDITNEITGTGYTAGGDTVTASVTVVAADSWTVSRANSTAYALGDLVRPATGNAFIYQAIAAGTSGGSIPTYPTTIGGTVVDGGVTWLCIGKRALVFDSDDPLWSPNTTLTIRQLHFYRDTGTGSTSPLIAWVNLGADVASTNDNWTYQLDPRGIAFIYYPN